MRTNSSCCLLCPRLIDPVGHHAPHQNRLTTHGVCDLCRDACLAIFDGAATGESSIVDVALM